MKWRYFAYIILLAQIYALEITEPGEFALLFDEEQFEDYLDWWLAIEENKWGSAKKSLRPDGCTIKINGDLGQPQPVFLHKNRYLASAGSSGKINLDRDEQIRVSCVQPENSLLHPLKNTTTSSQTVKCIKGAIVESEDWAQKHGYFGHLQCSTHCESAAEVTNTKCYNNNTITRVGYYVDNKMFPLYWSCFDKLRLEVLYVRYRQSAMNAVHQSNVSRPGWKTGSFYGDLDMKNVYSTAQQKKALSKLVGQELAEKYITKKQFLSRGHLAAKSDFVFATGQRGSFYYINAAPQWQPNNAGNWNWLEQNLRARIAAAGYDTVIYTGTFGVTQLRNQKNQLVDFYLHSDLNNNPQVPVPLYYYKVVYEESLYLGTAFVMINSPYYTIEEAKKLTFCQDLFRNNIAFKWLKWKPDRIDIGYSFCCEIKDFANTVPHLPPLEVIGILS